MFLSFVIPVYNEKETLRPLYEAITQATNFSHGVIFIDDGSTDGSGEVLDDLATECDDVEVVRFEENRGKTEALAVGFKRASGDVVVTMDSDLQDDPAEIPNFLVKLDEGYDLVCGWKSDRQDPLSKRLPSKVYNGCVARLFGMNLHDVNCGFKAMRIEVAKSLELKYDYHRLIPILAKQQGYKVTEIGVLHHARRYGQSKYGMRRYWEGVRDVWRVWRRSNTAGR